MCLRAGGDGHSVADGGPPDPCHRPHARLPHPHVWGTSGKSRLRSLRQCKSTEYTGTFSPRLFSPPSIGSSVYEFRTEQISFFLLCLKKTQSCLGKFNTFRIKHV